MTLPATYVEAAEAQALAFARQEVEWYRTNKLELFGVDFCWMDKAENQQFAVQMVQQYARLHDFNLLAIIDAARQGWDVADDALGEMIVQHHARGEPLPPFLATYDAECWRHRRNRTHGVPGPKRASEFFRNLVLCVVIGKICDRYGFKPRRRSARRESACSILARVEGMPGERALETIWDKWGKLNYLNDFSRLPC